MGAEALGARGVPGARADAGSAAAVPEGPRGVSALWAGSGPRGAPRGLRRSCGGPAFHPGWPPGGAGFPGAPPLAE